MRQLISWRSRKHCNGSTFVPEFHADEPLDAEGAKDVLDQLSADADKYTRRSDA